MASPALMVPDLLLCTWYQLRHFVCLQSFYYQWNGEGGRWPRNEHVSFTGITSSRSSQVTRWFVSPATRDARRSDIGVVSIDRTLSVCVFFAVFFRNLVDVSLTVSLVLHGVDDLSHCPVTLAPKAGRGTRSVGR